MKQLTTSEVGISPAIISLIKRVTLTDNF